MNYFKIFLLSIIALGLQTNNIVFSMQRALQMQKRGRIKKMPYSVVKSVISLHDNGKDLGKFFLNSAELVGGMKARGFLVEVIAIEQDIKNRFIFSLLTQSDLKNYALVNRKAFEDVYNFYKSQELSYNNIKQRKMIEKQANLVLNDCLTDSYHYERDFSKSNKVGLLRLSSQYTCNSPDDVLVTTLPHTIKELKMMIPGETFEGLHNETGENYISVFSDNPSFSLSRFNSSLLKEGDNPFVNIFILNNTNEWKKTLSSFVKKDIPLIVYVPKTKKTKSLNDIVDLDSFEETRIADLNDSGEIIYIEKISDEDNALIQAISTYINK